ncbi:modulator of apoptosis 1-like [Saccoglossus kowalevskii]
MGDPKGKDNVTFECWKYEVQCLLRDRVHSRKVLTQAIRKSVRGEAGQVVMGMGVDPTVEAIVAKLEGMYGVVDTGSALLQQFYNSKQESGETIAAYGCRMEVSIQRVCERGGIARSVLDETLRTVFWKGLWNQRIKDIVRHRYETVRDFDELLRIMRVAEQEVSEQTGMHDGD